MQYIRHALKEPSNRKLHKLPTAIDVPRGARVFFNYLNAYFIFKIIISFFLFYLSANFIAIMQN